MQNAIARKLKSRTFRLSLGVIIYVNKVSLKTYSDHVIAKQLIRSISSISANYRAVCRSKSVRDFVYKLKIVEEETDESLYWMELFEHTNADVNFMELKLETEEILRIIVSSINTARSNSN